MIPNLESVDHIHINVKNRNEAEEWYKNILGFHRIKRFEFWAVDGGPLLLSNNSNIHLALFESEDIQNTTVAFKVSSSELKRWISHLNSNEIMVKPIDHDLSWSIYFKDPFGNPYEITTYDYDDFVNE